VPGPERVLTWARWVCGEEAARLPEPKGKLDAMTGYSFTTAVWRDGQWVVPAITEAGASGKANGPEDRPRDATARWDQIRWREHEEQVRRLRQRIFAASRAGDYNKVRSLQKLMLRSRSNALVGVRQVTERNAGRLTPGVDGRIALSAADKERLAAEIQRPPERFRPVRRVFIPKAKGKLRPLGIPVIADRARQAVVRNALEPEWEARFEPRSYGFRPGRGCHDAMEAIYQVVKGKDPRRRWILDADLQGAFDHIDHGFVLGQLGAFPARGMVAGWLKAGVMDQGRFAPTEEGAPQGVIGPLILNIALHGMETAAGVRYFKRSRGGIETAPDAPVLVRYADDLLVFCHSREHAERVRQQLAGWLAPRGLVFNEAKTQIVHVSQGCDFLGFNVRRYHGRIPLIKPSKDAVRRIRERLRTEMRALLGGNAAAVMRTLAPIIRGWAAYYRTQVSSEVFSALDNYMWKLLYKWVKRTHPSKSRWWRMDRYFGRFNRSRNDRWIFGDKDTGAYLPKFAWTKIVRHVMVTGSASPDDPELARYWADRRGRKHNGPLSVLLLARLKAQRGRCPLCQTMLLHADREPQHPREWEQWLRGIRTAISKLNIATGTGTDDQRLIHAACAARVAKTATPASLLAASLPAGPA
jgi:RNA-directed DNA polymerase